MDSYRKKCTKPIPIGEQKYAYQCENVALDPVHGSIEIRGWKPFNRGKLPYPNEEIEDIDHYDLKISQFTNNALEVKLVKRHKDGSESLFLTTMSFSDLVNQISEGYPANIWLREAPTPRFKEANS